MTTTARRRLAFSLRALFLLTLLGAVFFAGMRLGIEREFDGRADMLRQEMDHAHEALRGVVDENMQLKERIGELEVEIESLRASKTESENLSLD